MDSKICQMVVLKLRGHFPPPPGRERKQSKKPCLLRVKYGNILNFPKETYMFKIYNRQNLLAPLNVLEGY